jgi:protein-L-isoaspartate O-methyltransferase
MLLTKIIAGTKDRKTRLHDELGHMVSAGRLLRNGSRAVATGLVYHLTGRRSPLPWISYDGQSLLAGHLTPTSSVLEFGAGTSTLWYAAHSGSVISVEHDPEWFAIVEKMVRALDNVEFHMMEDFDAYAAIGVSTGQSGFDLIMVDGMARDRCVANSLPLLAAGGIMYLDNSDKATATLTGDIPRARQMMFDYARDNDKRIMTITDFAPGQFAPNEATILFN